MDNLGSDLTGDGVPEIVFCCGSNNDYCYCVNGATGALVWAYYGQDAFFDVRSCQDINDDGIRDVVACLGDNAVAQQVVALYGANGAHLWSSPRSATRSGTSSSSTTSRATASARSFPPPGGPRSTA